MKNSILVGLLMALVIMGSFGFSGGSVRAESNDGGAQVQANVSTEGHGLGIRGKIMNFLGLNKPNGGDEQGQGNSESRGGIMNNSFRGIVGTVTGLTGSTITVESKRATTTITFSVDATNAKFVKDKATTTLASILVGDTVAVSGQVTGTTVSATLVIDGKFPMMLEKREEKKNDRQENRGQGIMGRGIAGTVTAVSGNSLTVTALHASTTTGIVYTVDATNAKIFKNKATTTITSILVGDTVQVEGTMTGTTVVAKAIRDGVLPQTWDKSRHDGKDSMMHGTSTPSHGEGRSRVSAAFESMGQFFRHMFGF